MKYIGKQCEGVASVIGKGRADGSGGGTVDEQLN